MTDDLRAFVAARLDEDEAAARAATEGPWSFAGYDSADGWPIVANDEHEIVSRSGSDDAEHIARHDPARVLREVAAKRAVIRQYEDVREQARHPVSAENRMRARVAEGELLEVLQHIAVIYSNHTDHDPNWSTT